MSDQKKSHGKSGLLLSVEGISREHQIKQNYSMPTLFQESCTYMKNICGLKTSHVNIKKEKDIR